MQLNFEDVDVTGLTGVMTTVKAATVGDTTVLAFVAGGRVVATAMGPTPKLVTPVSSDGLSMNGDSDETPDPYAIGYVSSELERTRAACEIASALVLAEAEAWVAGELPMGKLGKAWASFVDHATHEVSTSIDGLTSIHESLKQPDGD